MCIKKHKHLKSFVHHKKHGSNIKYDSQAKLAERQNDIYKMKQEISELTEKIDNQEKTFKRETKQFKKTFRIIQENTESDKQIFDSIQMEYEYEKAQKEIIKGNSLD